MHYSSNHSRFLPNGSLFTRWPSFIGLLLGMVLLAGCAGPGKYITVGMVSGLAMIGTESEMGPPEVEMDPRGEAIVDDSSAADSSGDDSSADDSSAEESRDAAATREPTPEASLKPTPTPAAEKPGATAEEIGTMLDGGKWALVNQSSDSVAAASTSPEITLTMGEGRITGSAGCNRFNGGYRLDGNRIQIAGLVTTRMACPEDVMEKEREFLTFLESVNLVDADQGDLILSAGDETLRFEARSDE